jgi:hypothetical protein
MTINQRRQHMDGKNYFIRVAPRPDGGFSVTSAIGGEQELEQICETAAEVVAAVDAWTTNVPQVAPTKRRG